MSEQRKIRVLLVDDHKLFRLSLFLASYDDLVLAGEASNGQEAVDFCQQVQPDVVLIDIVIPVIDGLTATGIITWHHPLIEVIILTNSFSGEWEQAAYQAGAYRTLMKNGAGNKIAEIPEAIRAAAP